MPKKEKKSKSKKKPAKAPRSTISPSASPPIYMLDRSAVIIHAKQPFVGLVKSTSRQRTRPYYTLSRPTTNQPLSSPPFSTATKPKECLSLGKTTLAVKQCEHCASTPTGGLILKAKTNSTPGSIARSHPCVWNLVDNQIQRELFKYLLQSIPIFFQPPN